MDWTTVWKEKFNHRQILTMTSNNSFYLFVLDIKKYGRTYQIFAKEIPLTQARSRGNCFADTLFIGSRQIWGVRLKYRGKIGRKRLTERVLYNAIVSVIYSSGAERHGRLLCPSS